MGSFLRSLFGPKKSNPKIKTRLQSRRLELIGLEERITPATVSVSGTDVLITLAAGENISDLNTSTATAVITVNTVGSANNTLVGTPTGVTVTNNTVTINTAAFTTFTGIQVLGSNTTNAVTVGAAGINLAAGATANTNQTVAINLSFNSGTGTLNVNGPIQPKNAGNVGLNSTTVTIAGLGDITATTGSVNITGNTITSAGDVTSTGPLTLTGTGDVSVSGLVSVASVNVKSSTGDVIFGAAVTTTGVDGFISEATSATKATKIANLVTLAANANALVTGNLISNNPTLAAITTSGVGNITITGNVDASVANNALTLTAGSAVTIGGNVGSSSTAMGDLISTGTGLFLASGNVTTHCVNVSGFTTSITFVGDVKTNGVNGVNASTSGAGTLTFSSSITSVDVTNTGDIVLKSGSGVLSVVGAIVGTNDVTINSTSGNMTLGGAISTTGVDSAILIGADSVAISNFGTNYVFTNLTLGNILVSGAVSTTGNGSGILIVTGATGSITTSSTLTTSGGTSGTGTAAVTADIILDTDGTGDVNVNGAVSTTNGGTILIGVDDFVGSIIGADTLIINATLTTSGTSAGDIQIGVGGGTATVNKAISAGAGGDVIFSTNAATDAITIASGANITAGGSVGDFGAGILNLGANITAGTASVTAVGIILDAASVNLTGAVSLKTIGTGSDITLASVNGTQNLTLEATDQISLGSVGQTTPLNTVTITNSTGIGAGAFTASNVVLSDTTGSIFFKGNTTITSSLSTAAKAFNIEFGDSLSDTTVLAGAPVFSNTGNLRFFGTTSLTSGAIITGGSLANVNLAGTIVSGGAFNIGAGLAGINVSDNTQLILNSITASSTFASPINLNAGSVGAFNLLGAGTLTLSANSTGGVTTGDTINVTNGILNVTGTLGSASTITLTNGTLTGPGGTVGNLTPANGTVDPQGTLNTGIVTFNAATTYIADVLTTTTASNLTGNAGFNLGGATLSLSSVASGLAAGNTFTIINNTAVSGGLSGTFAGLPEGATLSALDSLGNTITFAISYVGGIIGANDVTLTVTNVLIANPSTIPQPMVAGQPQLNYLTVVGAGAGGGPMVTVTLDIIPGLTTVPTYFSFFAYDVGFTGGVHVALNELDGNTDTKEIITGPGAGGGPNVKVFQFNIRTLTFNPTPVTSFFAFNDPAFTGGVYVAGGDVTGDGIGDLLVGAGEGGGPRVQVYAGSVNGVITSAPISDFFAYSNEFLGGVVVAAGDRTGDATLEVVTGPASNGGYNIKSFNVAGTGNNPTLIENFFAFNDFTSIGGLSIATAVFDANPMDDLVIGTTNTQFGIILNQDYEGIQANPFPGFDGEIRAGFVSSVLSQTYQAVAAAGPGGGPVLSVFIVDPINLTLTQTDSLFVFDPEFTGGLFVAN